MALDTISYVNEDHAATAAAVTTLTNTVPTGTKDGDLILWDISGSAGSIAQVVPTGWSVWQALTINGTGAGIWILYRIASGETPGTTTYSATGLASGKYIGLMRVYRGVDPDHPKDATPTTNASATQPAITTVTANAWVVFSGRATSASGVTTNTWSSTSGTVRSQASGAQGGSVNAMGGTGDQIQVSPGSVTPNFTVTGTNTVPIKVTSALRPATLLAETGSSLTITGQVMTVAVATPISDTGAGADSMGVTVVTTMGDTGTVSDAMTTGGSLPTVADVAAAVESMLVVILDTILFRRNTTARAAASNPLLKFGEPGWDDWALRVGPSGGGLLNDQPYTAMQGPGTISTKTANYAVATTDRTIVGNGASLTITLPTPVGATGRVYRIKNVHSSSLTVATAASTIDGGSTVSLAQWAKGSFVSDGAQWLTI